MLLRFGTGVEIEISSETKFKKLMKNVEDALAATTFAEEGKAETARSIMKEGRRVLLALKEGRIDAGTLKYALNTSKRIGADLDILHVTAPGNSAPATGPLLSNFESDRRAEGILYRTIRRTGCLKQQIIDYTNSER